MKRRIAVRVPVEDLAVLDAAVARGDFPSRSAAVRAAVRVLVQCLGEAEIAEEYRRAYGARPQEGWIGEVGLVQLGEAVGREEAGREPL
jgi:Arc/MetJ-type ribon-helix-helix transcriptional regulator